MDFMLAAEQMVAAQAQAQVNAVAAAAAAAYYQSAAAVTSAHTNTAMAPMLMTGAGHPPPPGFGLLPAPMAALAAAGMAMPGSHQHYMDVQQVQHVMVEKAREQVERSRDHHREERRDRRDRDSSSRRDRDRSRDRERRGRSRSRSRDRDRGRERSGERRSRRRSSRDRGRDRSPSRRDRNEEWSPECSDEDVDRNVAPNSTIMVRGLAQHIKENDIRADISDCGLVARDIRLIRKKESEGLTGKTGASRGFAFVEFVQIADAIKWMEAKQGVLAFKEGSRAVMQYSLPRDGRPGEPPKVLHDWICGKCGVQNFRRRESCFKCNGPKTDGDAAEGADEVSPHPTNTILLRGLDTLTTEDSVMTTLQNLTEIPIKSLRIGRDSMTNTSRGVCYVEMNTVVDAVFLHNQLLGEPPMIDDRLVGVSYYSTNQSAVAGGGNATGSAQSASAASAAMAAAQWSHQGRQQGQQQAGSLDNAMSDEEVERMAKYSADMYAKTAEEKVGYLEYYRNYYRNGGDVAGAGDARKSTGEQDKDMGKVTVNGVEYKKYPVPDVSTYTYEETSGYYYDASSGLYYDSKSQYYFNSSTNEYMYWSAEHNTYLPANSNATSASKQNEPEEDVVVDKKKVEKVKCAKKIAKDMEKWAKTLNQKKDKAAQPTASAPEPEKQKKPGREQNSFEDIAFSIMLKKPMPGSSLSSGTKNGGLAKLAVAGYGSDSEEEQPASSSSAAAVSKPGAEVPHTDWEKMACLLCKRQFPSKEKLIKHNQLSDLHKENLAEHQQRSGAATTASALAPAGSTPSAADEAFQYRDRAKERRQKFGGDEVPRRNKLKEKYLRAMEDMESSATSSDVTGKKNLDSSNIGNKMLQKMGWKDGQGLGKSNQGRTEIVEADGRVCKAGLGNKVSKSTNPNESYKDCVKRTLWQRYQDD